MSYNTNPYQQNPYFASQSTQFQPQPGSAFDNAAFNRPQTIPGKMVVKEDEITPREVPMDGTIGFFPSQDLSCIYAKAWNKQGGITTVRYVPEQPQTQASTGMTIEEHLNKLDERFDKLEKMLSNRKPKRNFQPNKPSGEQNPE